AADPANPYGSLVKWPTGSAPQTQPQRVGGARVLLHDGRLIAFLSRTGEHLLTFRPEDPADEPTWMAALLKALSELAAPERPIQISRVDGEPIDRWPAAPELQRRGFIATRQGYLHRGQAEPIGEEAAGNVRGA
ncbi:MAG: hypothetical protein AAF961_18505, partial [Planctomycetota bacterium]